ncbi:hypothetical protein ACIRQP_39590 [Streptomyces sp. NPDC102274]|uniref:hypothetical protein n=1 Tax=Streptomyces sp. NPDC102274 TaxID=3366151 RepID=UPI003820CE03
MAVNEAVIAVLRPKPNLAKLTDDQAGVQGGHAREGERDVGGPRRAWGGVHPG